MSTHQSILRVVVVNCPKIARGYKPFSQADMLNVYANKEHSHSSNKLSFKSKYVLIAALNCHKGNSRNRCINLGCSEQLSGYIVSACMHSLTLFTGNDILKLKTITRSDYCSKARDGAAWYQWSHAN